MGLMLLCIVGLGLGSTKNSEISNTSSSDNPTFWALLAVGIGIICPITFAAGGITVRTYAQRHKFNSNDMSITSYFVSSILLSIAMIFQYGIGTHPFILKEFLIIVFSGVVISVGRFCLNKAITIGYAGPVFALANIQTIIQSFLDAILLGQVPTTIEILSAILGIIGSCTIAVGPLVFEKVSNLLKPQRS